MAPSDQLVRPVTYCFGSFELAEQTRELRKFGIRIPLQPQPQTILLELVKAPGEVVTRSRLRSILWGDNVFVEFERNLTRSINKLRISLGDSADNPRFIETLPGIGYRFIAPVTVRTQHDRVSGENDQPRPSPRPDKSAVEPPRAIVALPPTRSRATLAWTTAALVFLGVVASVTLFANRDWYSPVRNHPASRLTRVVGVLPFDNISDNHDKEQFARGLGEEVNQQLSKIASLQVVGQNVLVNADKKDFRKIAGELGLDSVVVGSVRAEGDRARIGVRLIEPESGRTLWSEVYDRPLSDFITVQSEIALRVVDALQIQLSTEDQERLARKLTDNPSAYELYLRAQLIRGSPQSIELLRQAIQEDPKFAAAYGQLAICYSFFGSRDRHFLDLGLEAANKAISLDPQLATSYIGLANILGEMGKLHESRLSFLRALQWDPNSMEAMENLSVIDLQLGRYDEAIYWSSRGLRLARTLPWPYFHVGLSLTLLGPHDVASKFLNDSARKFPPIPRNERLLALEDFLNGDDKSALKRLRAAVQRWPKANELQGELAHVAFVTGSPDSAALAEEVYRSAPDFRTDSGYSVAFLNAVLQIRKGSPQGRNLLNEVIAFNMKEINAGSEDPSPFLEMAAIRCFQGRNTEALEWLHRAYTVGYRGLRFLDRDPFFQPIAADHGYQQLISQMKHDLTEMQNRSRADELQITVN